MKLSQEKRRLSFMSMFLMGAIALNLQMPKAFAQDDMLDEVDDAIGGSQALEMDDINLEGKLTPSERLRKRREKLEERNKIMVEKKIEDIRVKQEIELTKKLNDSFTKGLNNLNEDKVATTQAAPVAPQPVVAAAPVVETKIIEVKAEEKAEKASKVIPFIGAQSIKGDKIDFESKTNIGLSVENMIMPQVSMGLGLAYTTLDITDLSNDFINNGQTIYYGNGYNNFYGQGRKMSFNKLTVEANGKFFFTDSSKVKPFVGGAISYNRSNLKYEDNSGYNYNGINFGNEGFASTAFAGSAKLGAQVDFTDTIGLNVDLSYTKNISSGVSNKADTTNTNPDQQRLENITKSIEASDTTAIQAGLVVKF